MLHAYWTGPSRRRSVTHLARPDGTTLCGLRARGEWWAFCVDAPAERAACDHCLLVRQRQEADAALHSDVIGYLKQGLTNAAIARRVGLGLRTLVRLMGEMRPEGADTLWQWGYHVGYEEGRASVLGYDESIPGVDDALFPRDAAL